jgi:hypothetical protein
MGRANYASILLDSAPSCQPRSHRGVMKRDGCLPAQEFHKGAPATREAECVRGRCLSMMFDLRFVVIESRQFENSLAGL